MGFMTEISFLNDCWDQIEKNPKRFVEICKRATYEHEPFTAMIGNCVNHIKVFPSHHADDPRVYLARQNSFHELSEYGVEDYLRDINAQPQHIDYLLDDIERAEEMLANAKRYLIHLRDDVGHDEWPGQKDDSFEARNRHHAEAWRKSRRKARA